MFERKKLSAAIISVLATTGPQQQRRSKKLCNSNKASSSTQDIPVAVQAVTEDTLEDLPIGNFEDYFRYFLTSLQAEEVQDKIQPTFEEWLLSRLRAYFWGTRKCSERAMYLDEQPVTAPARNLDLYATDVQRVEVLPGPQGTLFGAAAKQGRFA
ncbi:MAG: hypothetical protein Ct9H90mP27_5510 [Gammaproteobacteria bacterium]|nr:MAG: hypothetical protein Ct9H90mP27_5510 [Gammaproteobacteria bacterium]